MSYATSSDQSSVMTSASASAQSPNAAVPDLVKIGQIPVNTAIDIETDILDPVVHSDTFCRFQFQNKGILHSNSKIVLRLKAGAVPGYLPVGVGIHSLIQRCALRVGTKTLCEIDDYAHYMGYKSMFLSNEQQKQREMYVSGRRLAHKAYYKEGSADSWGGSDQVLQTQAQEVGLDNSISTTTTPTTGTGAGVLGEHKFLSVTTDYGPEFAVSIQDLFPFLYQNQLPLFMMNEPVTIELFFTKAVGDRLCLPATADVATSFEIDQTATQLIADYQYFPQEMMEQYAQQNANLSFTFMDYRLAKRSIALKAKGTEVSTGQLIVNVGGAGRLVTKVFTTLSDDKVKSLSMLNNYHSRAMDRDYTDGTPSDRFQGSLTANVKYNDHFLYPVDVSNSAQQFHYLTQAEGMVPFIYRQEYNNEGQGLTANTYQGHAQNDIDAGLAGNFFYQAYKLNRNERVNSRGIELYNTFDKIPNSDADDSTATLRTYIELIRVAQLKDGKFDIFFA
jgi:hypothetical protein